MNPRAKWAADFLCGSLLLAALGIGSASARERKLAPVAGLVTLGEKQASHLLLVRDKPHYPPIATINYIEGWVNLQVMVGKDGHVREVHVLDGFPLLAAAALKTVRRWRYRLLMTKHGPAAFQTRVRVRFALNAERLPLPSRSFLDLPKVPMHPIRDFERQVRPPRVTAPAADRPGGPEVRLRLLLDDDGTVLDSQLLQGAQADFKTAQEAVQHWKFDPAHWGTLAIPWNLDVEVPLGKTPAVSQRQ